MPITGWLCPGCSGRSVPLDHFEKASCGRTHVHPHYANAVLAKERAHSSRGIRPVGVTYGLGCPRKPAIMATENVSINPLDRNAMLGGGAMHAVLELSPCNDAIVERKFVGCLEDVPAVGVPDIYWQKKEPPLVEDWKCPKDSKEKANRTNPHNQEYVAQVSLYADLIAQNSMPRPTEAILWYHYRQYGLRPKPVERLMGREEALAFRPFKNPLTVIELIRITYNFYRGAVKWRDMPLYGESMAFGGSTACDWCEVRHVCWTEAKGAPF